MIWRGRFGERITRRAETVRLTFGAILCEPDEPFTHVYLPLSGFISPVARVGKHAAEDLYFTDPGGHGVSSWELERGHERRD